MNWRKKAACIRRKSTNGLGKANRKDRREFLFYEAGFFGNLFLEKPVAYVCSPALTPKRRQHLESSFRVCSFPSDVSDPKSRTLSMSRCQCMMVGSCNRFNYKQDGINYSPDVLKVYLVGPKAVVRD